MEFLDRHHELARLDNLVHRRAAGLVVLWGRRRVGKTRLLTEWCARHNGLYTVADLSAGPVQRRYFAESIARRLPAFADADYPAWLPLLNRLSHDARAAGWRGPLVLDEFPNLAHATPALPSTLQNWIDHEAATGGLLVAIAGSSQRMMQGMVLDANAPLFGRAIEAMRLDALPAGWIGDALGLDNPVHQIQAWAVWGGIPRYWELAAPLAPNLAAAVDSLVLDPLGPLHREPDRLLLEEQPPAQALRALLDAIGGGAHRVSEIAGRVGQPATSLSRPLARLVEMGLVEREVPFGSDERNTKRTLYRLADPFFRFWFRVVAPNRASLHGTPADARLATWTRFRAALESQAWEDLCRRALPKLGLGAAEVGRRWWHGTKPEWDALARVSGEGRDD